MKKVKGRGGKINYSPLNRAYMLFKSMHRQSSGKLVLCQIQHSYYPWILTIYFCMS